jgi:phosphopantothenoylcysteine decarboxylase/phosphopantothenate--cysteine ligase
MDIGIFAAAVADYRPKNVVNEKIKKNDDSLVIEFVKNPDILAWAGSVKKDIQILVGFALETNNMLANGKSKLEKKNLDLIVMNNLSDQGAGFAGDTNKISLLDNHNNLTNFELKSKSEVAKDIVEYLINLKK